MENDLPQRKKWTAPPDFVETAKRFYLSDILAEMEKRMLDKFKDTPNRPVNVVILYNCRNLDDGIFTLKPHFSFLFKNLFYTYQKYDEKYFGLKEFVAGRLGQQCPENKDSKSKKNAVPKNGDQISATRTEIYKEKKYDIFFDKICLFTSLQHKYYLYYYQDVKRIGSKTALEKEISSYYDIIFPVRNENGKFVDIWDDDFLSGLAATETGSNEKNSWMLEFRHTNNHLTHDMFYIPKNAQTQLFYEFTLMKNLDISEVKSFKGHKFSEATFQEQVFREWRSKVEPFLAAEFQDTYITVMEQCFFNKNKLQSNYILGLCRKKPEYAEFFKIFYYESRFSSNYFRIFNFPKFSRHKLEEFFFSTENVVADVKNYDYFVDCYDGKIIRDNSFPYLTPIEYMFANYLYYEPETKIYSFLDFKAKNKNKKIADYKEFKESINMCQYNTLVNVYFGLYNKKLNIDAIWLKQKIRTNEYLKFTFTQCFTKYYDTVYSRMLRDGINVVYENDLCRNYLKVLPGIFVFQLDDILNNLSKSGLKYKKVDTIALSPWECFYKDQPMDLQPRRTDGQNRLTHTVPESPNFLTIEYILKQYSANYFLLHTKHELYEWFYPVIGDKLNNASACYKGEKRNSSIQLYQQIPT
jgi:hypothetical protein